MSRVVTGTVTDAAGKPRAGTFVLTAIASESGVTRNSVTRLATAADGTYYTRLHNNIYRVDFIDDDPDSPDETLGLATVADGAPIGLLALIANSYSCGIPAPPDGDATHGEVAVATHVVALSSDTTAGASDTGVLYVCTNSAPITITLPADLPGGTAIAALQAGSAAVAFAAGANASLRLAAPFVARTRIQNAAITATALLAATGQWLITGDCYDALA